MELAREVRINPLSASTGQNPRTTYNSARLPTALEFGSGDSDAYSYDANTDRTTLRRLKPRPAPSTAARTVFSSWKL